MLVFVYHMLDYFKTLKPVARVYQTTPGQSSLFTTTVQA